MWSRDLIIDCSDSPQEMLTQIETVLRSNGKFTQVAKGEAEHEFFLVQPETTLLHLFLLAQNPSATTPVSFRYGIRFQAYNLPDPEDQRMFIESFPNQFLDQIQRQNSTWNTQLSLAENLVPASECA